MVSISGTSSRESLPKALIGAGSKGLWFKFPTNVNICTNPPFSSFELSQFQLGANSAFTFHPGLAPSLHFLVKKLRKSVVEAHCYELFSLPSRESFARLAAVLGSTSVLDSNEQTEQLKLLFPYRKLKVMRGPGISL